MGPRPQLVLVALLVACGPGPVSLDAGAIDTGAGDTASIDVGLDGGPVDSGPEPCTTEGAVECTPDGYAIRACAGGFWGVTDDCMRAHGQLCEAAACVDPWRVGSPAWDTCAA